MNYKYYYDELISRRGSKEKPRGYSESHHILPRCMGGKDNTENLVYLSFKDHVFAHWLLWKIHRDKSNAYAYYMMSKIKKENRPTANHNRTVEQAAQTNLGRKFDPEVVERRAAKMRGTKKPKGFGENLSKRLNEKHHLAKVVVIDDKKYRSSRKAAEALGVSHRTIGRMVKRGEAFYE